MEVITTMEGIETLLRWLHVLAGITWIGVLYYFNFIQTPYFSTELGGQARSLVVRGLVPNALWWFRWGAMFTFLSGWTLVLLKLHGGSALNSAYMTLILTGGAMGTLMWFNVWFVIWPAQQVVIANAEKVAAGGEADPAAGPAGARAGAASRTNTLFSIPLVFFMVSAANLQRLATPEPGNGPMGYWIAALVLIALFELNPFFGTEATKKPLGSVSGTIHAGLGLAIVLIVALAVLI